ncbi:unnamed protein product [Arctogadus glacialis]
MGHVRQVDLIPTVPYHPYASGKQMENKEHKCQSCNNWLPTDQSNDHTPLLSVSHHVLISERACYMTASAAAAPMQGTYIPQYTAVPPAALPVEGVVTDSSPQSVAPSSQEVAAQQQQIQVDGTNDHVTAYSYQSK